MDSKLEDKRFCTEWLAASTRIIQRLKIQNGRMGKGNHSCEDFRPSRSQPRLRSQRFPFVFAFKETSDRPEVSRRRFHSSIAWKGGGRVLWRRNTKPLTRVKQMPRQMWWLCRKIPKGVCSEFFSIDFVDFLIIAFVYLSSGRTT